MAVGSTAASNPKTDKAATKVLMSEVPSPSTAPGARAAHYSFTDGLNAEVTSRCGALCAFVWCVPNYHFIFHKQRNWFSLVQKESSFSEFILSTLNDKWCMCYCSMLSIVTVHSDITPIIILPSTRNSPVPFQRWIHFHTAVLYTITRTCGPTVMQPTKESSVVM